MPIDISETWNRATVAEPIVLMTPDNQEVGAFILEENALRIYSLNPTKDFEIDGRPDLVWNMVFMTEDGPLGIAPYGPTLEEMRPYILDMKDESILVRALEHDELCDLFVSAGGIVSDDLK